MVAFLVLRKVKKDASRPFKVSGNHLNSNKVFFVTLILIGTFMDGCFGNISVGFSMCSTSSN